MRCLVTGATGFVGGTLCEGLRASGHEVVAYVRESSEDGSLRGFETARGDLADPNLLKAAANGCDAMIHAAGIADPAASEKALGWTHVAGTENALNAAKAAGCRLFVHLSCADVTLHDGPRSFWNEDRVPTKPVGMHAQTKLEAEELVRVSGRADFATIALRPALVWGPGDLTHMPGWAEEAAHGGIRLVAGGKKIMATTYTANLAHAVERALAANVSTGNVYYVVDTELGLVRDFFGELSEALGWPKPRRGGPYWWERLSSRLGLSVLHPTQVLRRGHTSAFEMNRAKKDLGYEPVVARDQGMRELAAWFEGVQKLDHGDPSRR